ncbi:MAG: multiheme c-type cytochrome [Phycisphaerales bacterium]|nr:multiheme c-type cytochrome [Phycisphaerales bacterium]|tara:strand:- start:144 stop:2960 length:2817 start_codon:yes stop_codon:yes gene_type:complete
MANADENTISRAAGSPSRPRYRAVIGPKLKILLFCLFALFALLIINSVYLLAIRVMGLATAESYENWFYLIMFLAHLILGLALVIPVILFGIGHIRNAHNRPNRRAVRAGYALFASAIILLVTGVVLMRVEGIIDIRDQIARSIIWWIHVMVPLVVIWLFILHRLAGRRIKWGVGLGWAAVAAVFALIMVALQSQDPRQWNIEGNPEGDQYFFPSLARTVSGDFISEEVLQNDEYCLECHADIHDSWMHSVHKFSSFNNPAYLASVKETREMSLARDGDVNASRFCAGCHDPVPFFSGAFNDPDFDMINDPTAHAGITCTVCHVISNVNSPRGNADYTIDEPQHYPFAFSDDPVLSWVNKQLVKAKPEFHKKSFLKPLHKTEDFCGACHKVHLPEELNDYKWLRGQNHLDSFRLSGVSGHGVSSFYYPPIAEVNCNNCHMPLMPSTDFGAQVRDDSGIPKVHDHMFPSANTAMPRMVDMPRSEEAIAKHQEFLEGVMRLDLFALKKGGEINGEMLGPLRPEIPVLDPGEEYLLEAIIRTVKMGHLFTQGTADSNQVWMDVVVTCGDEVIGRSGQMDDDGGVDPWSHFVNSFVIDREGDRIARRNAEDIFTSLYNNQIPPGAADSVHYRFHVPADCTGPITIRAALKYRKFDTQYMRFVHGDQDWVNDLPVTVLAEDVVVLPVKGGTPVMAAQEMEIPEWIRWNDYGIGLFRKGDLGELKGAEQAFSRVEELGRSEGPINLARVYLKEGRVTEDAPYALTRAAEMDHKGREWHLLWFGGQVDKQNGRLDEAISKFKQVIEGGFEQAAGRGFDFAQDWRVLNELGNTLYQRARQERGPARQERRQELMEEAAGFFDATLDLDPENVDAHYNLKQIWADLGDEEKSAHHASLHSTYKVDDNARDHAISEARRKYPAGNRASEAVVIYDLDVAATSSSDEGS